MKNTILTRIRFFLVLLNLILLVVLLLSINLPEFEIYLHDSYFVYRYHQLSFSCLIACLLLLVIFFSVEKAEHNPKYIIKSALKLLVTVVMVSIIAFSIQISLSLIYLSIPVFLFGVCMSLICLILYFLT
jgi:membrane-associated HD superfamily phosphohydrolase